MSSPVVLGPRVTPRRPLAKHMFDIEPMFDYASEHMFVREPTPTTIPERSTVPGRSTVSEGMGVPRAPFETDTFLRSSPGQPTRSRPGPARQLLAALLVASAAWMVLERGVEADQPAAVVEYVVAPGDTLWEIADDLTPPGDDVRRMVSVIRRLNDLERADLRVGQRILVPRG